MLRIIRRLWVFMVLSAALNLAVFALVGHFWRPLPRVALPPPPHMMLLTLLPPSKHSPSVPQPRPVRRPKKIVRRATPLPPAPRRVPQVAPVAAHSGGAHPQPRPQRPLVAVLVPHSPIVQPPPAVTPPGLADTTQAGVAATPGPPASVSASGTGSGTGSGAGTGMGSGTGLGAGPFGITGDGGGGTGPRHVVYLLDTSGSMSMPVDQWHGQTRIERARAELETQLQSLGPGETFSLIAFADGVHLFRPRLVPANAQEVQEAEAFLSGLTPEGDTDLEGALDAAFALPSVNVIYVITDGVPRTPDHDYSTPADFNALANRVDDANRQGARIYTIGLLGPNPDGTDESAQASTLLTQIASDSGGTFKAVALDNAPQDRGEP